MKAVNPEVSFRVLKVAISQREDIWQYQFRNIQPLSRSLLQVPGDYILLIILALSSGYSTEIEEEKKEAYGWINNG